jgi:uncharacterized protein (DUF302 family)
VFLSKEKIMENRFAFQVVLDQPYDKALELVSAALKEEGFGVLTHIDVQKTLKEKIDQDFEPYAILGACNPPLAHKALASDPRAGLMLPCNITVREVEGKSEVTIINPDYMLAVDFLAENDDIRQVAEEAKRRLARVAAVLEK